MKFLHLTLPKPRSPLLLNNDDDTAAYERHKLFTKGTQEITLQKVCSRIAN